MVIAVFVWVAATVGVYLPGPHDTDGWGLRVHNFSVRGPYLVGENISQVRFDITLLNFSEDVREHDPFPVAQVTGDLVFPILQPDGKQLRTWGGRLQERDPFTQPSRLRAGEFSTIRCWFPVFYPFLQTGHHRLEPSMKIGGKTVTAPPVTFEVVAVPPSAVLVSHAVRLEGRGATGSARPVVQQVPVGGRTLLIYRGHYDPAEPGGGPYYTKRLAELPEKCEMTVEGAYGDRRPLTITYKASPDAKPTKLVINSVSGSPWTDEEERLLQERLKGDGGAGHVAPPPRAVGP